MIQRPRILSRDRRGIAAVEFALITPVLVLLAGGIVDGGLLLRATIAVHALTMQYAISWADCPDDTVSCAAELTNYTNVNTLANIAPDLNAASLSVNMVELTMLGTTPNVTYSSGGTLNAAETAAAQAVVASGNTGVVVSVSYQYSPLFFANLMRPILGDSFSISYTVAQLKSNTTLAPS